jgi:ribonuclease P protein component
LRAEGFPARLRLRKRSEFLGVQKHGRRLSSERFLVLALARPGERTRIGITVSRKVANAVGRNRIKRLVREAFRRNRSLFPAGYDIVCVARREAADASFRDVERELTMAASRLRPASRVP